MSLVIRFAIFFALFQKNMQKKYHDESYCYDSEIICGRHPAGPISLIAYAAHHAKIHQQNYWQESGFGYSLSHTSDNDSGGRR